MPTKKHLLQAAAGAGAGGGPWDISTAVFNGGDFKYTEVLTSNPTSLFFKPDGTKFFYINVPSDTAYAYDLSTAWDLTTATYNSESFYLPFSLGEPSSPDGITFKSDGTKMYVVDGYNFFEYNLSTAWDISTAVGQFSVTDSANTSNKYAIQFKPDGTKFYVFDVNKDFAQYTASTTWSVNSASTNFDSKVSLASDVGTAGARFHFVDGNTLLVVDMGNDVLHKYTLSTAWDISTLSYSQTLNLGPLTNPVGVSSNSTGTKIYISDITIDRVVQYELGTAKDLTTTTVANWYPNDSFFVGNEDTTPNGLYLKPDGTKMYITGGGTDSILEYNLSIDWEISTASYVQSFSTSAQDNAPQETFFKPDGTKMYVTGGDGDDVNEYSLSTAWDVSTASFVQLFYVGTQDTSPRGLSFKDDGTKMYIAGNDADAVHEYSLSTAWDISTSSYVQSFSILAQESLISAIFFKPDGTKMYITGTNGDDVNEYSLSTAWDISTSSYVQNFSVAGQESAPNGLSFKDDGTKMYVVGNTADAVFSYDL